MKNTVMKSGVLPVILFGLLLTSLLVSCGEGEGEVSEGGEEKSAASTTTLPKAKTPQDAYAQLVAAVESRNYGGMYDLMDSANRHYTRMWFDLNLQQLDRMDSAERAGWAQFKNMTDTRDQFIRLVEVTPPMRERFLSGYRVMSVDTVVAVVTQHRSSPPQITYFRWEDGGYKYTAPPESKIAPAAVQLPAEKRPSGGPGGGGADSGANKR